MRSRSQLSHPTSGHNIVERLFGPQADGPAAAERVLTEARGEMGSLLGHIGQTCSTWPNSPADDTAPGGHDDFQRVGEMLRQAAQSLPHPDESFRIVLLGRTQAGKSTLFSYLTGSDASPVGHGAQRCTRSVIGLPMAFRSDIVVLDTPGVGALDGEEDREIALDAARQADLVVWVATSNSQPSETASALSQVAKWGKPIVVVFNCREDLAGDGAIDQFLAYPETTFADLDGHRARLARFLDPHGQRPLQVLAVHAAAALLGGRADPVQVDLLRESRVDEVVAALQTEANRHRHARRAVAIVDSGRQALIDSSDRLADYGHFLALLADTRQAEGADFDQRAARLLADDALRVQNEIDALFRRFDNWADRHYQRNDAELQQR